MESLLAMSEQDMLTDIHRLCDEIEINGFAIVRNLIDRDNSSSVRSSSTRTIARRA